MFDTHAHLQDDRLRDLNGLIERARQAGVVRVLCCATRESDWIRVGEIAAQHAAFVQPAYGIHPWYLAPRSASWLEALERLLAADPGAAVGEIGLDGGRPEGVGPDEEEVFRRQIRLARKLARPVSVHGRKAWDRLLNVLGAEGPLERGIVLHSYSGPPDYVPKFAELNGYFSFSGSITWSGNRRAQRALAAVPLERLLVETDAPDIPAAEVPANERGERLSEPAHLPLVIRAIARLRGWPEEEVRRRTTENAFRVFGRPEATDAGGEGVAAG